MGRMVARTREVYCIPGVGVTKEISKIEAKESEPLTEQDPDAETVPLHMLMLLVRNTFSRGTP